MSRNPASSHSRGSLKRQKLNGGSPARRALRLHHGVGRALDAPGDSAQRAQVAHEGGLAGAQFAFERDEGIVRAGAASRRAKAMVSFVGPEADFYTRSK